MFKSIVEIREHVIQMYPIANPIIKTDDLNGTNMLVWIVLTNIPDRNKV
jgi:hypothetical protein